MQSRSQSSMEFLMTYGWAILAAVVALGIIYSLGIFSAAANAPTSCVAISGFSCTKPVLYSSGALNLQVGQIGPTKTITAIGCSSSTSAPTTWQSTSITLQSGQIKNITFACPIVQGSKLGTLFQGTVWLQYSGLTGGAVTQAVQSVGQVKTSVQSVGVPGAGAANAYVPVTIINYHSATPSSFQQMIQFNPTTYSLYESSDLGNIRFYQGGTALYSWCESGCTRGSSTALFWVNIPSGIQANSNALLYMTFISPNSVEYDGVYAGEAPQLSCNNPTNTISGCAAGQYGKYDNGGSVFANYWDFAGTSLPAGWSASGDGAMVSVLNGITVTGGNDNAIYYGRGGAGYNSQLSGPFVMDSYADEVDGSGVNVGAPGIFYTQPSLITASSSFTTLFLSQNVNGITVLQGPALMYTNPGCTDIISGTYEIYTLYLSNSTSGLAGPFNRNYLFSPISRQSYPGSVSFSGAHSISFTTCTSVTASAYTTSGYVGLVAAGNTIAGSPSSISAYWVRTRATPPIYGGNPIMPSVSFGSLSTS